MAVSPGDGRERPRTRGPGGGPAPTLARLAAAVARRLRLRPGAVRVGRPSLAREPDGRSRLQADVALPGATHRVFFRATAGPLAAGPEPFLLLALLPAMRRGARLRVDGPVSARLRATLPAAQGLYRRTDPSLVTAAVHAVARPLAAPGDGAGGRGVAAFFSGGVDSFHTFFRHADVVTHLVFVHGFDLDLADGALRARVVARLRSAARALGRPLVEVETNARELLDPHADWATLAHGAALAAVAHALAPRFAAVLIPGSGATAELVATGWGSHPALDPLLSTEVVAVVHDHAEVTRREKVAAIARHDVALATLRVCWENRGGAYNCGRCEKCLRTMADLRLCGALERCATFDRGLDLGALAALRPAAHDRVFYAEALRAAQAAGDAPLAGALAAVLAAPPALGAAR